MTQSITLPGSVPLVTCEEAWVLETGLFAGDEAKEWPAMQRAGCAIATALLHDFEEIGGFPVNGRLLVLVGKGHNGGDALIAAQSILKQYPEATAEVVFAFGQRKLRPLAARAWREASHAARDRWSVVRPRALADSPKSYEVCLDGIFGFQFRAPAEAPIVELIEWASALPVRLRAAVDLPSAGLFHADFTYATGSVKAPVLDGAQAGRVRYLDLGFFHDETAGARRVLTPQVLAPLAKLRPAASDKRTYGHLFVVAGSRYFPGAAMMAVQAGLRSGVGLLTAFVPESLVPTYAAQVPEAMWVGWPETPTGGMALEGVHLLRERISGASALVIGPGIGRELETLAAVEEIVRTANLPVVLDADALQPAIVRAGHAPRVLTPHAGEYARIAGEMGLEAFAVESGAVVALKGPITRVAYRGSVYHSFFGGPVLARGGSGDLLAGLTGGLLAQAPGNPLLAAARGAVWHGLAADALARAQGQVAVRTTQLLEQLGPVLREEV